MRRPKVISLYSGAGGLDYGFEAAGYETGVALEWNHDCCETMRANREWPVLEANIFDVTSKMLLDTAQAKKGDIDVLIGGPPCQPFSKAGYWARGDALRLDDPRSDTLSAYMRVLEDTLPKAFLLENVEGLAFEGKDEGLQLLLDRVRKINKSAGTDYQVSMAILNAADYGVPQQRERVFLIGHREGKRFVFPTTTHTAPDKQSELPLGLEYHRTAWDALADVKPDVRDDLAVRGKWAELLPSIPEGNNYLWHTERGGGLPLFGWRRRYWTFLLKLAKARPSWTIQAQPGPAVGPFHWDNRRLSMRELCRIQTFPDDVIIQGNRGSIQKQVGNAVASLLAEVLGREIRSQLLGHARDRSALKLVPPKRRKMPSPEMVGDVPEKFQALVGQHTAHPGTGKGYGAVSRESLGNRRAQNA